jgi:hypothetical protein
MSQWRLRQEKIYHEDAGRRSRERLFDNWFDLIETELRTKVRGFIEA